MVWELYASSSAATLAIGVVGAFRAVEPIRRLLAINIAYSGVFLVFVALARRNADGAPDVVPHALVLTGIVVSVSSTAVALALARRLAGSSQLERKDETDGGEP